MVVLEGILTLYYPEVRELLQMKLFVDLDSDTRLCRRGEAPRATHTHKHTRTNTHTLHTYSVTAVERDTKERGRDLDHILWQYTELVKPAFEEFTLPVSRPTLINACDVQWVRASSWHSQEVVTHS